MREAVVVAAKRTPVGKEGGALKHVEPEELAASLIQHILEMNEINGGEIDEVILGNAVGPGGNIARKTALKAGLPESVPGVTIDRQCGSGLEAITIAARLIQAGAGDLYLAGGVESTSRAPWRIHKPRSLYGQGPEFYMRAPFAPEETGDPEMGEAAENVAEKYGISRSEQDRFAANSHAKAWSAQADGRFASEIVPVPGVSAEIDEGPRANMSERRLRRLPPVFIEQGTVTSGNACQINDGAAVVLLMSKEKCSDLGLSPLLTFVDANTQGVDPNYLGIGPVPAVQKLLERQQLTSTDIDLVEFNEAFASQVLASLHELKIPEEKVNAGGGAIAFGHPYGASGAILVTRLVTEMNTRAGLNYGLATLGIGGGMGSAVLFQASE
ncbi:thiolase family protein [Salsuginibacillus kocurii]|uniref:thiolase family protein n=1 Tax=Salsuginibacillus kocurii TaxID=427078 RepID=UPI0003819C95|nr:thiolase family protein [Salsuginibacillus kocurii]